MGFLQKNINIFLMLLVLFVAMALAASSVYYQDTFKELTSKHENTLLNLSKCEVKRDGFMNQLNRTQQSLNTTSQDVRRYDELYSTKITELQSTQTNLSSTVTTLSKTKNELTTTTQLKEKYKKQFSDTKQVADKCKSDYTVCVAKKKAYESDAKTLKSRLSNANDCVDKLLNTYDATLSTEVKSSAKSCKQSIST